MVFKSHANIEYQRRYIQNFLIATLIDITYVLILMGIALRTQKTSHCIELTLKQL